MPISQPKVRFAAVLTGLLASLVWLTVWPLTPLAPVLPPVPTAAEAERVGETRPSNAPAGSLSLEGRVTAAADSGPIDGAGISVTRDHLNWTTTTDRDGRWMVSGLPEGDYGVTATKQGYRTTYALMPPVRLSSARPHRTLDLRIHRGGSFAGRVSNAQGDPLPGMTVTALRVSRDDRRVAYQFQGEMAITDINGEFRLSGLADGEFVLAVIGGDSGRPDEPAFATTYLPDAPDPDEARRFPITDGIEYNGLRVVARGAMPRRAAGRVVTSERLRGSRIEVSYRRLDDEAQVGWSSQRLIVSGWPQPPDDTFDYRLLPGRYRLSAKAETSEGLWEAGALDVALTDRDVTGLVLRTYPPARLQGRVVPEKGRMRTGAALRIGVMSVSPVASESLVEDPPLVASDGTFEIRAGGTEARFVLFQPSGGWEIRKVTRAGRELADAVLRFQHGEVVRGIVVTLRRRASVIEGTLSTPAFSGCVTVLRRDDRGVRCVTSMNVRDGEFRSMPLLAGAYRVAATCASMDPAETLEAVWDRALPVELADDEVKTIRLEPPGPRGPAGW